MKYRNILILLSSQVSISNEIVVRKNLGVSIYSFLRSNESFVDLKFLLLQS